MLRPFLLLAACCLWVSVAHAQVALVADFEPVVQHPLGGADLVASEAVPDGSAGLMSLSVAGRANADGYAGGVAVTRAVTLDAPERSRLVFWLLPDAEQAFDLAVLLQEDDDGDGVFCCEGDDVFATDLRVEAGTTWQRYELPLAGFVDDDPAEGNGVFDPSEEGGGLLHHVTFVASGLAEDDSVRFAVDDLVVEREAVQGGVPQGTFYPHAFLADFEEHGMVPVAEVPRAVALREEAAPRPQSAGHRGLEVAASGTAPGVALVRQLDLPDVSEADHLSFYLRHDGAAPVTFQVVLSDDDDGDGAFDLERDEYHRALVTVEPGSYQPVSLPLGSFEALGVGDGVLDLATTRSGGNGGLLAVLVVTEEPVAFDLDDVAFTGALRIDVDAEAPQPSRLAAHLGAPQPNPFVGATTLALQVPEAQHVRAEVFTILGQRVATLHDGVVGAGEGHQVRFDGAGLAPGIYLVRVLTKEGALVRRVVKAGS